MKKETDSLINRMALDLGIYRFEKEPLIQYECRVIYSAMACWMKVAALDRPVGYQGKATFGVSRRHIFEKTHVILEALIKMFPEIKEWFGLGEDIDDPVKLIRTRLINHGDLLNCGFDTNIALSSVHFEQITPFIETAYGKTIEKDLHYSGVASIKWKEENGYTAELDNVKTWMQSYLNVVSWSHDLPDSNQLQFFNPLSASKNNYTAWQESIGNINDKVILVRTAVNNNSYSYYLLKPKQQLIHRIDPFLQDQGLHIRVMYALRSQSKNNTVATVIHYNDHVKLRLYAVLPLWETIMIESYAWPKRRINDKLEWVMSISIWDYIKPYIEALDIHITEEENG